MANAVLNAKDNFKVVVKSRPLIKREKDARLTSQWKINGNSIESINPLVVTQRYTFGKFFFGCSFFSDALFSSAFSSKHRVPLF